MLDERAALRPHGVAVRQAAHASLRTTALALCATVVPPLEVVQSFEQSAIALLELEPRHAVRNDVREHELVARRLRQEPSRTREAPVERRLRDRIQ